jgi:hypothetical protein
MRDSLMACLRAAIGLEPDPSKRLLDREYSIAPDLGGLRSIERTEFSASRRWLESSSSRPGSPTTSVWPKRVRRCSSPNATKSLRSFGHSQRQTPVADRLEELLELLTADTRLEDAAHSA